MAFIAYKKIQVMRKSAAAAVIEADFQASLPPMMRDANIRQMLIKEYQSAIACPASAEARAKERREIAEKDAERRAKESAAEEEEAKKMIKEKDEEVCIEAQ